MPSKPPLLWHFAISHFTEKARWALDYKRVPISGRNSFSTMRSGCRCAQGSLSVLFWDDEPLCDSTRIIEALEDRAPEPPLYPEVPDVRRCALELEDFFDEELGPHLGALVIHALFGRGREATAAAFGMTQPE